MAEVTAYRLEHADVEHTGLARTYLGRQLWEQQLRRLSWQKVKRPLAGLVLTLGLLASGSSGLYFKPNSAIALPSPAAVKAASAVDLSKQSSSGSAVLPGDGVYLYGQSSEPNQVGHTYAVFEVVDNQAVGAFYMPSSSFDCFYGEVGPQAFDLVVVNSYEQAAYPYSVPLTYENVASGSAGDVPMPVGYHRIDDLSQQDYQMISTCRSDSQRPAQASDRAI